jgi:hypothetical protein
MALNVDFLVRFEYLPLSCVVAVKRGIAGRIVEAQPDQGFIGEGRLEVCPQ